MAINLLNVFLSEIGPICCLPYLCKYMALHSIELSNEVGLLICLSRLDICLLNFPDNRRPENSKNPPIKQNRTLINLRNRHKVDGGMLLSACSLIDVSGLIVGCGSFSLHQAKQMAPDIRRTPPPIVSLLRLWVYAIYIVYKAGSQIEPKA